MSLCACLVFTANAAQASDKIQSMIYDVYAGGFHVVQANVLIDYSKKNEYALDMEARTYGFLGKVAPWHGTFETHGWVMGDKRQPKLHRSVATWRGEDEINSYNYGKDGSFKSYVVKEHDKPEEKKEVDDALTQGTIDALTAGLLVFEKVGKGEECTGFSEVFDGKRRFKQMFKHEDTVQLESSKYNIYKGPATECVVEIEPITGKWHDKPRGWMSIQEQGRERGMMPTVWLAKINENGPAVPVKIRVKTAYGTLFMHLAEYKSGDTNLIAEKRTD